MPTLQPQVHDTPHRKRVIVIGGGVAGLSAAHELAHRGFEVHVYERRSVFGGKARSVAFSPKAGGSLPAEHGFRFFPGFYKHVIDTMTAIPCERSTTGFVAGNLETVSELRALGDVKGDPVLGVLPLRPLLKALPDWVTFLPSFLDVTPGPDGKPLTGADLAFFGGRIWTFLAMCKERRESALEGVSWSTFVGSNRSYVYEKYLAVGLTRNLVACKAEKASAFTVGTVGLQLLIDAGSGLVGSSSFDRVLDGPTSAVWIDPWVAHLEGRGVAFHPDRELSAIDLDAGPGAPRVARVHFAATATTPDARAAVGDTADTRARQLARLRPEQAHEELAARPGRDVEVAEGDYYVFALPVEQMATFVTDRIKEAVPEWAGLPELAESVEWMNGVLFYMTDRNDLPTAHTDYLDSDWALTSIDQGPRLWPDWLEMRGTDPEVQEIISVDVSDWTAPRTTGPHAGKSASELTRDQVIEETWTQVKAATVGRFGYAIDDRSRKYAFVDDDIAERQNVRKLLTYHRWRRAKGGSDQPLLTNAEPLLVNQVGTRKLRPDAASSAQNAFLASDYVKTYTDLATMEGANEAARRAVNAILSLEQRDDLCSLFPLEEPLAWLRDWDLQRFRRGLPQSRAALAMGTVVGLGVRIALLASQVASAILRVARRIEGSAPRAGQVVGAAARATAPLPPPPDRAKNRAA
jgi:15-cis-phytoene desaturase